MYWDAVSITFPNLKPSDNISSLAYCEIYVTLGTLFRRYQALKPILLSAEDLQYEDYFAPYRPVTAKKFHVTV